MDPYVFPYIDIPMDSANHYAYSFDAEMIDNTDLHTEIINFFNEYGYIVFSNVLKSDQIIKTKNAMWEIIEKMNPGFQHDDINTWHNYKSAGKYGLSMRGPCFHPILVENRQNILLAKIFSLLINIPLDDVMVSHDRYTIYRATLNNIIDNITDKNKFKTGDKNIHLDMNPWWYEESSQDIINGKESLLYNDSQDFIKENNLVVKSMGTHIQAVINILDNEIVDGGTLIIPASHKHMYKWNENNLHLKKPLPFLTFHDKAVEGLLLSRAHRIPMKAGSVLLWNQNIFHGTCPNESNNCRMAQFIKGFSRSLSFKSDEIKNNSETEIYTTSQLKYRAQLLRKCLIESSALDTVNSVGVKLFALDTLTVTDE